MSIFCIKRIKSDFFKHVKDEDLWEKVHLFYLWSRKEISTISNIANTVQF